MKLRHDNLANVTRDTRGWLMGAFTGAPINHPSMEVKVLHTLAGHMRPWVDDDHRTTLVMVLQGQGVLSYHRELLAPHENVIVRCGQFVQWSGAVAHSWYTLENSIQVVLRWDDTTSVTEL